MRWEQIVLTAQFQLNSQALDVTPPGLFDMLRLDALALSITRANVTRSMAWRRWERQKSFSPDVSTGMMKFKTVHDSSIGATMTNIAILDP